MHADTARAVASCGLRPAPAAPIELDAAEVAELVVWCAAHRTEGLAVMALNSGVIATEHADVLVDAHHTALRGCLLAEETAVDAVRRLDAIGVPHRVLKGIASANLDYADTGRRVFGDADILIPREMVGRALAALMGNGYERAEPPVRPWWERRFAKAVVLYRPDGSELDLHLSIAAGWFGGRLDHDRLWRSTGEPFVLAGTNVIALDAHDRLLHACLHAEVGKQSGVRALRDVAELVLGGKADWRRTVTLATADGIDAVVAAAFVTTWQELALGSHPAEDWALAHRPDPMQSAAMSRFVPDDGDGWAVEARGTMTGLGRRDRILFALGVVAPSSANLRRRGHSRGSHLRNLVGSFRHTSVAFQGRRRGVLLVTKGLDLGGLERVVADLAIGLHRRGRPVSVVSVSGSRVRLRATIVASGVAVDTLGGTDRIGWRAAWRLVRAVRDDGVDLVHVHSPVPAVIVRLARPGRPGRSRVITTLHTPWRNLHPVTRLGWRMTAARDHATIVVSGAVAASLPQRIAARTIVVPHGIDPAAIARAAAVPSTRAELGIENASALVVTVASHRDVKNYPNLLHAMAELRRSGTSAHLVAVGDGDRAADNRRLAQRLGLRGTTTFLSAREDVLSVMAAADVVVVASDFEGQPLVVLEALALGRPVVATAVGRVPELVSPLVGRVVAPNDPRQLAAAVAELLADDELRASMSAAAVTRSAAWTINGVLDAHEAVYDR